MARIIPARTSGRRTLADHALDHRVALADAERKFELAIARAARDAAVAKRAADMRWYMACKCARDAAVERRELRRRYRNMPTPLLLEDHRRFSYMLQPEYAQHMEHDMLPRVRMLVGLTTAALQERGELP